MTALLDNAPDTPWFDAIRAMREAQLCTMQERATLADGATVIGILRMGLTRKGYAEQDRFGVPVNDAHARFSVATEDASGITNGMTLTLRGITHTIVDSTPDAGLVHFRLEAY